MGSPMQIIHLDIDSRFASAAFVVTLPSDLSSGSDVHDVSSEAGRPSFDASASADASRRACLQVRTLCPSAPQRLHFPIECAGFLRACGAGAASSSPKSFDRHRLSVTANTPSPLVDTPTMRMYLPSRTTAYRTIFSKMRV